MQVSIYSRQAIETLIKGDFPKNSAVISFLDPPDNYHNKNSAPVDYKNKAERIFYVAVHDIDLSVLPKFNLSYETYFPEADHLAEFIFKAKNDGLDIICQCEYGEAEVLAVLLPFLNISINRNFCFADYRYYPNQVIYHKVFDALSNYQTKMNAPKN